MTWLWTWKIILSGNKSRIKNVKGLEKVPEEPYLLVSNHNGYYDAPVLLLILLKNKPIHFIARRLWYSFVYLKWFQCIEEKTGAVKKGVGYIKKGESIIIMPESRINTTNLISEYKTGAATIALLSGVKVLPVGIKGDKKLEINIGKPFKYQKMNGQIPLEKRRKIMNEIMSKIAKLSSKRIKWI
ncbi:1-acyl-sn-glycerol-3-phosphate acyltransferase [archaeon]|nr:1-acyl-sn-glycerol-3-phosphate acyltransferase [archaeon]